MHVPKSGWLYLGIYASTLVAARATEVPTPPIKYETVAVALDSLKNKAGVVEREQRGWTVLTEKEGEDVVIWTFSPPREAAYPAVVRRRIFKGESAVLTNLAFLCEAPKAACDKLVADFQALTAMFVKSMQGKPE